MMRVWIRISPFLVGLTVLSVLWLLYWSWCWGWWGRNNLLLQYLIQCRCPVITEQARFPIEAQVLVSACQDESTKQRILSQMLNTGFVGGYHVAKDWWVGRSSSEYMLINPEVGGFTARSLYLSIGAQLDPETIEQLHRVNSIYWQENLHTIVALDATESPEQDANIVLTSQDDNYLFKQLLGNGITYKAVGSGGTVISRNHLFVYRGGIRLVAEDQQVVDGSELAGRFFAVGWAADDRGALLEGNNSLYLYGGGFQVVVPTGPVVPQPILLLRVPAEYLPPHVRAEMQAQMQQEQLVRTLGNLSVLLSLGAALFLSGLAILRRTRRLPR